MSFLLYCCCFYCSTLLLDTSIIPLYCSLISKSNLFLLSHHLLLLTSTTDGFYLIGLQGFVEHHDTSKLALQGRRTSPLAVLCPRGDELSHRLRLSPEQSSPGLWRQDATERGASGGRSGRGEGRVWNLRGWGSCGAVACWADAARREWL